MPLAAKNYSCCYIYVLHPKDPASTDCYVGSTSNITARLRSHRGAVRSTSRKFDNALYRAIRASGGWDAWECKVLEQLVCASPEELHAAERRWFDQMEPTLNKHRPAEFFSSATRERNAALVRKWMDQHPGYYRQWLQRPAPAPAPALAAPAASA
jgi:hypothetical protein